MESRLPPDPIYVLRGSTCPINIVKFAPACVSRYGLLASGSSRGIISLWDLKTKRACANIDEHNGKGILGLDITADSKIVSHGRDGSMNIWDLADGCISGQTKISSPVFGFCKFSTLQNGGKLWLAKASSNQSQIDILDIHSRTTVHIIKPDNQRGVGMCMCLKLFNCPTTHQPKVLAGFEDGYTRLFDVTSGKSQSSLQLHSESVMCVDIDGQQQRVVTGSADSKLVVSEFPENILKIYREVELKRPGIADVKIRADSKLFCTGDWDGKVRVYSWKTLKPLAILNCHSGSTVNAIDFSQPLEDSGVLMAAGSKDCRISIWSIYNE